MKALQKHERKIFIFVGLIVAVYAGITIYGGYNQILEAFSEIGWGILYVFLLSICALMVRCMRWYYYMNVVGAVSLFASIRGFTASYALSMTPGKMGFVSRCYLLRHKIKPAKVLGALFVEQYTNIITVLAYIALGITTYYKGGFWICVAVLITGLVGIVLLRKTGWGVSLTHTLFDLVNLNRKWHKRAKEVYHAITALFAPVPAVVGFLLSATAWSLDGVAYYIAITGVGGEITLTQAIFVHFFAALLASASMLPGGIGGYETIALGVLAFYGVPSGMAVASIIIIRFTTSFKDVPIGLISWSTYAASTIEAGNTTTTKNKK